MPVIAERLKEALAAHRAGRLEEAESGFRAALEADPRNVQALCLLAMLLAQGGRLQEALVHSDRAARLSPADAKVRLQRANILHDLERHEEALADFDFAMPRVAVDARWHVRRGRSLSALRRPAEALASFDAALALGPDNQIRFVRAVMLHQLRRLDEAIREFRQVAVLEPDNAAVQMALAYTLLEAGQDEASVEAFDRAYLLSPTLPLLAGNRRGVKLRIGDWRDYDSDLNAILAGVAAGEMMAPGLVTVESTPAQQQAAARLYAAREIPAVPPPLWTVGARARHERLRIAYVSKDLREHATMVLAGGLFENHDRTQFETFAISLAAENGTATRARAEAAFEHFHHAENLSNKEVAALMRRLEIDIAVDLDGYTKHARNAIFGYRPAPVAVNFLGYPGTMGSPHIDYIIADRIVLPEEERRFYDEEVIYMPVTYQPSTPRLPGSPAPSRAEAGLPQTGFVFCCFNAGHKITPPTFDVWMRILDKVDGSVLWLLESSPALQANLRREAGARGVAAERLIFARRVKLPEHLGRHTLADLFLDTLPFNAHTTASDSLWCGVPVLTCKSNNFSGRVAASLNAAIGMEEMTVTSLADYQALAVSLAQDSSRLAALKTRLQANRDTSALFDIQGFTRQLEATYRTMWERHVAKMGQGAGFAPSPPIL